MPSSVHTDQGMGWINDLAVQERTACYCPKCANAHILWHRQPEYDWRDRHWSMLYFYYYPHNLLDTFCSIGILYVMLAFRFGLCWPVYMLHLLTYLWHWQWLLTICLFVPCRHCFKKTRPIKLGFCHEGFIPPLLMLCFKESWVPPN